MSAHHFAFSRNWSHGKRLCGECGLPYDDGDHIEITTLKPYTSYVCPTGGGLGHSSIWTGAHRPEGRTLRQHLCVCGTEFVEEDRELWEVTFEALSPNDDDWHPVSVVRSRHAAHEQEQGLLECIAQGEPIRNVHVRQVGSR